MVKTNSKSSEKGEPKKGGSTFLERAKNYMPAWERPTLKATLEAGAKVATFALAVQAVGASGLEGRSLMSEASDTPLALRGGKDQTSSSLVALEQANFRDKSLTAPSVSASQQEWVYKGPSVEEIWPNVHKEYVGKIEEASKGLHQGEAQGKDGRETALDFHSRKVTPGGETARSAMDVPSSQRGQDKSKGVEDLELSREEFDTLKTCAAFLKEHPEARKCLQMVQNDKEVMGEINDLMQDEVVRRCVISELKNKENVERAILLWEDPKALQVLKKVFNNKKYMENFKHLMQDKELGAHNLYSLEDIRKLSLTKRMIQEVNQSAEPPSTSNTLGWIASGIALAGLTAFFAVGLCCCQDGRGNQDEQRNQGEQGRERNRLITEFANQHHKLTFGSDSEQSSVHSDGEQSVIQVSQSDSCNKRPNGPKNENERFMVWLALAKMKGETIKMHESLAMDNPERFDELKIWASEEFEKWKEQKLKVEQGTSRPLTLDGPSSSLCPEDSELLSQSLT